MKFASGPFLCRWEYRGRHRFLTCMFGRLPSKTLKLVGNFCVSFRGGCSYSSAKRDSSFRWAFLAALAQARPGLRPPPEVLRPLAHGSGIQARFCAALRCRPARRDDAVGGPSGLGRTAGHAPDDRRRSSSAACLWLQRARQAAGIGGWRALARRWGRHPWARAKPLKGDPVMRLLGQETLRRGRATGGRQDSCAVHDLGASDGESAPWRQDVRAVYSPTALCGAFWMHGAHILPKLAVLEYMKAIYCHEVALFPSGAPSGTHRGDILPRPAARERIGAISCHGQAPNDRHRSSSTVYLRL